MKNTLTLLIICICTLCYAQNKQTNTKLDVIDAYSLKISETFLFGNINDQLITLGTPDKLTQQNQSKQFESCEDAVSIIRSSPNYTVVTFSGLEFWCFNDMVSIPCKIDFRKLDKDITGNGLTYNRQYSVTDFKQRYPNSFANTPNMGQSFFRMATQENIYDLKHFIVKRNTISDKDVQLLVEFTFKDDKLIYIFFANF